LKYLIDFIKAKDIKKSKIYPHLKCSEDEAKILQNIVIKHIEGSSESLVYMVLNELYPDNGDFLQAVTFGYIKTLHCLDIVHLKPYIPNSH